MDKRCQARMLLLDHRDCQELRTLTSVERERYSHLERSTENGTPVLLELDDDQRLWRQTVEEALAKQCPPSLVRAIAQGEDGGDDLWRWYCRQGWTELNDPESFVELVLVLEEMGRASDPTPFLATTTQFAPLVADRADPQRSGATVYDGVSAHRTGAGWVLDGVGRFVLDADRAQDLAVVTEAGVFVVEGERVTARRAAVFDPALHVVDVLFDGVEVSEEARTVADTEGARHIALTGMAIHTVGACQRILDMVLQHVKERHQFGAAIVSAAKYARARARSICTCISAALC